MLAFAAAVASDPQMKVYIDDPRITASTLTETFLAVCADRLDEPGSNLVRLLVEYGRLPLLPDVASAFEALRAGDEGVLDAEITSAVKPADSEVQALVRRLETRFGKKIEASVKVDSEIIGGIKIVIGDTVIDASVRGQLQELAYTLKS